MLRRRMIRTRCQSMSEGRHEGVRPRNDRPLGAPARSLVMVAELEYRSTPLWDNGCETGNRSVTKEGLADPLAATRCAVESLVAVSAPRTGAPGCKGDSAGRRVHRSSRIRRWLLGT